MNEILLIEPMAAEKLRAIVSATAKPELKYSAQEKSYGRRGETAVIPVKGVLTEEPDFFAAIFGGGNATYRDIISATKQAEMDNSVTDILYLVDSPGGEATGMFKAADAIFNSSKPTKALVTGMAASAAYALASQADSIVAEHRAVSAGSIGVLTTVWKDSEDEVTITSSEAPLKAPNPDTEEGRAAIQERLDALEVLFHETIERKRKIKDYGQGKVFLADKAREMGFIDSLEVEENIKKIKEDASMDLEKLKASHSDLYAQVKEEGRNDERERVLAHLTYGKESGRMDFATEAIQKGDQVTEVHRAKYLTAKLNTEELRSLENSDVEVASVPSEQAAKETLEKAFLEEFNRR